MRRHIHYQVRHTRHTVPCAGRHIGAAQMQVDLLNTHQGMIRHASSRVQSAVTERLLGCLAARARADKHTAHLIQKRLPADG